MRCAFPSIKQGIFFCFHALQEHVLRWIKPPTTSPVVGTLTDLTRGKAELLAENALLRHQLIILRRQIKRPVYRKTDRVLLVLLARMVRTWKQALFLVQPEAVKSQLKLIISQHKEKTPYFCLIAQISTCIRIKQRFVRSRFCGTHFWFFGTDVPNSQHRNKSDSKKVPPHWLVISERTSPLAGNGRHAVNPLHAALNYAYALLDNACRSALNNMGSMLHADTCTLTSFTEIVWSMI